MYAKRIQIRNYGPIAHINIAFPFTDGGEKPKPVLLVGENGSGKSILLSHIVDGFMMAQGKIYTENSEVEQGKLYKFLDPSYIKSGNEYSWRQIDFEKGLYHEELVLAQKKKEISKIPASLDESGIADLWKAVPVEGSDYRKGNFRDPKIIKKIFDNNSILYFPHNRFEEPAWLNERNLKAKAHYMNIENIQGYTDRKIINYSPLHDNKNWLFEVLFDKFTFETRTLRAPTDVKDETGNLHKVSLPFLAGYKGAATDIYSTVLAIVQRVFRADGKLRFGIGKRQSRSVSLMKNDQTVVPNIFQLSSGETALLNLFLSILRDFDLSRARFTKIENVRGIVIVDEIDLHLHTIHQHEVLPELIKMFPRVQFIVTTHSPLFVLGMEKTFGTEGFALYRLPEGQQISPEEFSEFGSAYQSFTDTKQFADDINEAITNAQKPVVFVEGKTDIKYLQRAADLLDRKSVLERVELKEAGGSKNLAKIWSLKFAETVMPFRVVLLYDCDNQGLDDCDEGKMSRRRIPRQEHHPLKKGVENLFEKTTLEKACEDKLAYIDIKQKYSMRKRGEEKSVPEEWTVNENEKTNLCDWLCEHGTVDDFKHFGKVFDLLEETLGQNE